MPELPDVEIERRYLAATSLHRPVERVEVHAERLLRGIDPPVLGRRLHGQSLESAQRHGKWLLAVLDGEGVLTLHFGMSGRLRAHRRPAAPAQFTQVRFLFEGGGSLDYIAPRKLGAIGLEESLESFVEREGLGPDAWSISEETFGDRLGSRRSSIKSALTNQRVLAGLGNIYADEALFQAHIDPRTPAQEFDSTRQHDLYQAMCVVLERAIDAGAEPKKMPDDFLLQRREVGAPCPRCDGEVEEYEIGGRRGYLCPRCQS